MRRPCSVCGSAAVAVDDASREALCAQHYVERVQRRIEKIVRRAIGAGRRRERVLVAVSGGKDSAVAAHALASLSDKLGLEVSLIHLELGIGGYSEACAGAARQLGRLLGLETVVARARELLRGLGVPELSRAAKRPTCSVCGLLKRYLLNAAALAGGFDYVATGHNADDVVAYYLKGLFVGGSEYSEKLRPASPPALGAAGRLRPLFEVSEHESRTYALLTGLPVVWEECPLKPLDSVEQLIKEFVSRIEERAPGSRARLLRRLSGPIEERAKLEASTCSTCGSLSSSRECSFCRLTRRALGEPLGASVREALRIALAR
ncbi:MAG: tRNA 2-thiocytidine biosynthesis TtcA family protein [Fervidicoccaceae archaeon]